MVRLAGGSQTGERRVGQGKADRECDSPSFSVGKVLERSGPRKITKFCMTDWAISRTVHPPDHREKIAAGRVSASTDTRGPSASWVLSRDSSR